MGRDLKVLRKEEAPLLRRPGAELKHHSESGCYVTTMRLPQSGKALYGQQPLGRSQRLSGHGWPNWKHNKKNIHSFSSCFIIFRTFTLWHDKKTNLRHSAEQDRASFCLHPFLAHPLSMIGEKTGRKLHVDACFLVCLCREDVSNSHPTGVDIELLRKIGERLCYTPEGFKVGQHFVIHSRSIAIPRLQAHAGLKRQLKKKMEDCC